MIKRNQNEEIIFEFYNAFSNGDYSKMAGFYHPEIEFRDPIFGLLKKEKAISMWQMLLKNNKQTPKITFENIKANEITGSANWVAKYNFSKTNRNVVNNVSAEFVFKDGLILQHTDSFNLWKWSKQAIGFSGFLLGWTAFFQNKIKEQALNSLNKYMAENKSE